MRLERYFLFFAIFLVCLASPNVYAGEVNKHAPHWGYEGDHGPAMWGGLSAEFSLCSKGKAQSPIDIKGAKEGDIKELDFFYYSMNKIKLTNNGHTVQVNYQNGSTLSVDGKEYELMQFHFHTPSEHTINGKAFDMEAHFVHKNDEGKLAVVGILMEKGENNAFLDKIISNIPKKAGEEKEIKSSFNAADILPVDKGYYRYPGSLTTPPCTEGVEWHVLKNPIQVSEGQLKTLEEVMHENSRPVQPLYERSVETTDF